MKTLGIALLMGLGSIVFVRCSDASGRYIDLGTGEEIVLKKDPETGRMVNAETGEEVRFYIDGNKDTIDAITGLRVERPLVRTSEGEFVYADEYKLERDSDGEMKEKVGDDYKVKRDDNGEYKVKRGDYKKKVDDDGSVKIKQGNKKIKIDEDGKKTVKIDD